ncbi:MAG TPA: TIGR03619 family F420-dependent LLM class oxidoreductase, partial [Acidimicrobiales bacterium]|nr:TIGR03619 family F420-dependent LLM class oxidoreductase [Acidimicrobiales bacterium]
MTKEPYLSLQLRTFSPEAPDSWQSVVDQAIAADRAGVGKVVVSDHVVFGEQLGAYGDPTVGGVAGGKQPTGPDGHWLEPVTFLSVISGLTESIRLGTNILLAALRRPAVLAKTLATLDVLSCGRVDLGVGVGWQKEEYDACGLSFVDRGRILDHTLEVCQALWQDESVNYESPELSFASVHAMPKPFQEGGVPIWVSGTVNNRSMKRLATFGSGWIPWGTDANDIKGGIRSMREMVSKFGRDPEEIKVMGIMPIIRDEEGIDLDARMEGIPELVETGVTDFRAYLPVPMGIEEATDYLSNLVERFN